MKKRYYLNSIAWSLGYIMIGVVLIGFSILCCFADEIHSGVILAISIFIISAVISFIWSIYSFTARIEFDYKKKILYIQHVYGPIKIIRFKDIYQIKIKDYNRVEFIFIIITCELKKYQFSYSRYYKSRPSKKITKVINEIKADFNNINNRNY